MLPLDIISKCISLFFLSAPYDENEHHILWKYHDILRGMLVIFLFYSWVLHCLTLLSKGNLIFRFLFENFWVQCIGDFALSTTQKRGLRVFGLSFNK